MSILKELLDSVKDSELDLQVKQVCDKIMIEEKENMCFPGLIPTGPNIFLAIDFINHKNELKALTLERESKESYIICVYRYKSVDEAYIKAHIREKVWVVDDKKCEKILQNYAEKLKFFKGDI